MTDPLVEEARKTARLLLEPIRRTRESEHTADLLTRLADRVEELTDANEYQSGRLAELEAEQALAEDFRAEIVVDAFTAPDAEWHVILDSLRSRIRQALSTNPTESETG